MKLKQNLIIFSLLICIYCLLILAWGYEFGQEGNTQTDSLALYANNSTLFAKDFYIQNAIQSSPGERYFFMFLLSPFGNLMAWSSFILHFVVTIIFLYGLYKTAKIFLDSEILSWLSLLILFFPLYYHNLGGNELYDASLAPNLTEQMFDIWAIYFWLRGKRILPYILLILSTWMHPLGGFQIFLLITMSQLFFYVSEKNGVIFFTKYFFPVLLYLLTGGLFVLLVYYRYNDANILDEALFHSFFSFRNAHHYIPHAFNIVDWIVLTPFYCLVPFVLRIKQKKIFYFSLLILVNCVIYIAGVELFRSVAIASSQWFKTTEWLEFLAVIGGLMLLQKIIYILNFEKYIKAIYTIIAITCIAWIIFILPGVSKIFHENPYNFPVAAQNTAEMEIALQAKILTETNALFIQPCSFSELRYFGERSSYIDYKGITHRKSYIANWNERFDEIYGINPVTSEVVSWDAVAEADKHFKSLSIEKLILLKVEKGITHIITFRDCALPFHILTENDSYILYEL